MRIAVPVAMIVVLAGCGNRTNSPNEPSCLSKIPNPVFVKSADVRIGSDNTYPEESPARTESIARFEIDATEVTNAQFAEFVKVTNYVTSAENVQPGFDKPGAAVFTLPSATQPNWWQFVEGADWRHPEGPNSSIKGRERDPVVQVSHTDAKAYAKWAGRRLPSEIEWEYAATGGSDTIYPWGDDLRPGGKEQANTWQGAFPIKNTEKDGYFLRAPVGCYPANDFGLYDMIGNVWEWTDTVYEEREGEQVYAIKGGSFLCAENYCRRYRAPARQPQEAGFSTNHIGFRTVKTVN